MMISADAPRVTPFTLSAAVKLHPDALSRALDSVPERLSGRIRASMGVVARKISPWPGCPDGDGWVEVSVRYLARGVDLPQTSAWRILRLVMRLLGASAYRGDTPERQRFIREVLGRRKVPRGCIWRIPGPAARALRAALDRGDVAWTLPHSLSRRRWFPVTGWKASSKGTCRCPHPEHDEGSPSRRRLPRRGRATCAYTRHGDGTYHLTCQTCVDGYGRPITLFGVVDDTSGRLEASLTHRAMAGGGKDGADTGWYFSGDERHRSTRIIYPNMRLDPSTSGRESRPSPEPIGVTVRSAPPAAVSTPAGRQPAKSFVPTEQVLEIATLSPDDVIPYRILDRAGEQVFPPLAEGTSFQPQIPGGCEPHPGDPVAAPPGPGYG